LGTVLGELTQKSPLATGVAVGHLALRWDQVVGERLAKETSPAGFHGNVLIVEAASAGWAAQVRFLAREVAARVNEALGDERVREVRVTLRRAR